MEVEVEEEEIATMPAAVAEQPPPPPPEQQLTRITTCDRHPDVPVIGLCALCLRDRLLQLEISRPHKPDSFSSSSSSSVLKSLFSRTSTNRLRRSKSFSAGRRDGSYATPRASSFEPQRKSCDVRGRSTLWSLFHEDDRHRPPPNALAQPQADLGFPSPAPPPVLESKLEDDDDEEEEFQDAIAAEEVDLISEDKQRPIREHIVLDHHQQQKKPPPKDFKEIAGSFWLAASVFSKKLQKWRRKQKLKKQQSSNNKKQQQENRSSSSSHKPSSASSSSLRPLRRSLDMPDDVFAPRRSCDVIPRFSLDAGRISLDDPRASWDEPRASWDGYLISGRSIFQNTGATNPPAFVPRSDGLIPVEEDLDLNTHAPGGALQARDYYGDFPQRPSRRSLDRSNNGNVSARVSFELGASDSFRYSSSSLRDEYWSESFDSSAYRDRDPPPKEIPPPPNRSRRRWSKAWNLWSLLHRRTNSGRAGNGAFGRSLSENWPELRADPSYPPNSRMLRSNSNVSSRSCNASNGGGFAGNSLPLDMNGRPSHNRKRRDGFGLERNWSTRYSPANNASSSGMLRFYLPPMRSGRPGGKKSVKEGFRSSNSFARNVLQLY